MVFFAFILNFTRLLLGSYLLKSKRIYLCNDVPWWILTNSYHPKLQKFKLSKINLKKKIWKTNDLFTSKGYNKRILKIISPFYDLCSKTVPTANVFPQNKAIWRLPCLKRLSRLFWTGFSGFWGNGIVLVCARAKKFRDVIPFY